mgnify:CR=1 FL=1
MRTLLVGVSTRALAESAVRAGMDAVAVDYFGDLDQRRLIPALAVGRDFGLPFDEGSIYKVCLLFDYDGVIYTGGADIKPALIDQISRGKLLFGNDSKVLRQVRDPLSLREACRKGGIGFPVTFLSGEAETLNKEMRWLVKPVYGGSGFGIDFYDGGRVDEDFYVQQFVSGLPASASFLSDGMTCRLLGMTRQLIGDETLGGSGFKWCGNVYPLFSTNANFADIINKISNWGSLLTGLFGLKGLFGVDFVLDSSGKPFLVEINPRYSASMELMEPDVSAPLVALHVSACLGEATNFTIQDPVGFAAKGIVYATCDAVMPDTSGWLGFCSDIPFPGEHVSKGSPICTVFGRGQTQDDCIADLYGKANEVYRELKEEAYHE